MFKKNGLFSISLKWGFLFSGLLLLYPSQGSCQSANVTGSLIFSSQNINLDFDQRNKVKIRAYVAPREADGGMRWEASADVTGNGNYSFFNSELPKCKYFLEASMWETEYVNQFYATAANGTRSDVINPNRATPIDVCIGSTYTVDFDLKKGGRVTGEIGVDNSGVYTTIDGMHVTATAVLSYYTTRFITILNDNVEPNCPTFPMPCHRDANNNLLFPICDPDNPDDDEICQVCTPPDYTQLCADDNTNEVCDSGEELDLEILGEDIEVEDYIYLRDTYSPETTIIDESICSFRVGETLGNYSLQGIYQPETNFLLSTLVNYYSNSCGGYTTTINHKKEGDGLLDDFTVLVEAGGKTSKCGNPFNYQHKTDTRVVSGPGDNLNEIINFTLSNGNEIFGNILTGGSHSFCNARIGLYRSDTIPISDTLCNSQIISRDKDYFKLIVVNYLNDIAVDYPSTGLTCDSSDNPYYTTRFTFSNLDDGVYRVKYMGDYLWDAGDTTSSAITLANNTVTTNMTINTGDETLPAPKVFLNQDSGCSSRKIACWTSGSPPDDCCPGIMETSVCNAYTEEMWSGSSLDNANGIFCNDYTSAMEESVCIDYTTGNIERAYEAEYRSTHYIFLAYSDSACLNLPNANSYTIPNDVINVSNTPYDSLQPKLCECYDSSLGQSFKIRAYNTFNNEITDSQCFTSDIPYEYPIEIATNNKAVSYPLSSVASVDFLSNTITNTVGKSALQGLALVENNVLPDTFSSLNTKYNPDDSVHTIQLASLGWGDYLFSFFKKVANKVFFGKTAIDDDGHALTTPLAGTEYYSLGPTDFTSSQQTSGADQNPAGGLAFSNLSLMSHVISNLPDTDGDLLPDYWEECKGLGLNDSSGDDGTYGDPDVDGLTNYWEYFYGTDPNDSDSDNDGMPDGWEVENKLNPLANDGNDDSDGDGLNNLIEYLLGSDPNSDPDEKTETLFYVNGNAEEGGTGSQNDPFRTIKEALATATTGRVILVAGGLFNNPLVYTPDDDLVVEEGVRLIGDGAATTTIDLDGNHRIEMKNGGSLIGFTVINPPTNDAAIVVNSKTVKITNNILLGSGNDGTGLSLTTSESQSEIHNNLIRGFTSGIKLQNSDPDIRNNIITGCGTAIEADNSTPVKAFNDFWDNDDPADNVGNPLFVDDDETVGNFHLQEGSPLRDSGDDRELFNDLDDTRNDIGPDGGPFGNIDQNIPFVAILPVDPGELTISMNDSISFDGTGSMDEWGIKDYCWNFGALDYPECESILEEPVQQFTTCGDYPVTLTITDHNDFSASTTVMVKVGDPAEISLQITPEIPIVNEPVEFSAEVKVNDVFVPTDFDLTINGEPIDDIDTYFFPEPGLYELIISVDENSCISMVRELVTVVGAQNQPLFSQPVGPGGETIVIEDDGGPLHGIEVEIPANALSEPVPIVISELSTVPSLPDGVTGFSVPINLGPDGIDFCRPVTIKIPYTQQDLDDAGLNGPEELRVFWYDDENASWKEVPVIEIDTDSKLLVVETNHFSTYQTVVSSILPAPERLTASPSSKTQITLRWRYSSDNVDGFVIERSNNTWDQIKEVDNNVTHVYSYTEKVNDPSALYYYRIIAFKNQVVVTGDRIKSESSNEASARASDWTPAESNDDDKDNDEDKRSFNDENNDSDSGGSQSSSSGGGGIGCGLTSVGAGSGGDALIHILVLFLPLFIFRRRTMWRK